MLDRALIAATSYSTHGAGSIRHSPQKTSRSCSRKGSGDDDNDDDGDDDDEDEDDDDADDDDDVAAVL